MAVSIGFNQIYIIGNEARGLQNFCSYLTPYTNLSCKLNLEDIGQSDERNLFLVNIKSQFPTDISGIARNQPNAIIAMIFVDNTMEVFPYLCIEGVNGLFHQNEREEIIHKGIYFLDRNELFFPRSLLPKLVSQIKLDANHSTDQLNRLSAKEREVLHLLSDGASNLDISDSLNISFHTVKTHVYNIYRKLNVKNRAEAIRLSRSVFF